MIIARDVTNAFLSCLYGKADPKVDAAKFMANPPPDCVVVKGLVHTVAFRRQSVEDRRQLIRGWLETMSSHFRKDVGGGWTSLNMCEDRDGNLWTGRQQVVEQLIILSIAAGYLQYCTEDRTLWEAFPGGMPYVVIDLSVGQPVADVHH